MSANTLIPHTSIRRVEADGVIVFYREAGPPNGPVILLLHGFPTSSFQYRELIPRLADRYRVIAPDLPGFGFTEVPEQRRYKYSFDALASTVLAFTDALQLKSYALYVFDYGAPVGFRLAMTHPKRVTAIVSQNGNAYEEGLGDAWGPIRKYWAAPTTENREVIRKNILTLDATRWRYTDGVTIPESIAPESYTLDWALLERPGNSEIQLDLFLDYASNVKLYPKFQEYFRESKPPLLAIWGKNDPFSFPQAPTPSDATTRTRLFNSWIPDTLRSKPTSRKSLWRYGIFWKIPLVDLTTSDASLPRHRLRERCEATYAPLGKITENFYDSIFDINVKGVLFTVQKALPLLRDGGSIVWNASIVASKGFSSNSEQYVP